MLQCGLDAYLNAQLGKYNSLSININYAPETFAYNQYVMQTLYPDTIRQTLHQTQNLFTPWLRLHSKLSKDFSNDLTAGYYAEHSKGTLYTIENYKPITYPTADSTTTTDNYYNKASTLFIGEHVRYTKKVGNWLIEPAVDFRYSKVKDSLSQASLIVNSYGYTQSGGIETSSKGNIYLLTPSFTLGYKNIFGLQGGAVEILNKLKGSNIKKAYPFVTTSFDILKALNGTKDNSLKLFGSYAKTANLSDPSYPLQDFSIAPTVASPSANYSFSGGLPSGIPYQPNLSTWLAQGGITWQAMHNRLYIAYTYERRAFNAPVEVYLPYNGGSFELFMVFVQSSTHRLAANIKLTEKNNFTWFTGITVSTLTINKGTTNNFTTEYATGDYNTSKPSFTGGWVNRGKYKNFVFGLDVMYHLNQQVFVISPNNAAVTPQRKNSLLLQNVYAGYKIKNTELYIAARNPFQNNTGDLTNGNRYYGVGVKTGIFN